MHRDWLIFALVFAAAWFASHRAFIDSLRRREDRRQMLASARRAAGT